MAERWLYAWGVGSVSFGGASLLVPLYVVGLGGSTVDLGVLFATATAIGAPGAIVFGRLANRVEHRRSLVVLSLAIVAAVLAAMPFLRTVTAVIVGNAVLWLAVASVGPVLTMVVVDDTPASDWGERIGLLNTAQGYGWAGGLVLGTAWPFVGARVVAAGAVTPVLFWVLALAAGGSAVAAARTLPRPTPAARARTNRATRRVARLIAGSRRGLKSATFAFAPNQLYWTTRGIRPRRLLARLDRALLVYFAAATFVFAGSAVFWAPLPLFLTEAGFDSSRVFLLYFVSSVGSAVFYQAAGRLSARHDMRLLQSAALAVRGVLFPPVAVVIGLGSVSVALVATVPVLVGIGLTWAVILVVGTAIVTRLAPRSVRGEALGIYTALSSVAGGLGGVLGGWLATFGPLVAFGVAGALVLCGAGLVVSLRAFSPDDSAATDRAHADESATTSLPPVTDAELVETRTD